MEVNEVKIESESLKDNPLKDPYCRKVYLLLPKDPKGKPIIVYLSGYHSSSLAQLNYDPYNESLLDRIKRLKINDNAIFILPDTFTKYGGNQYIDSPAVGNYEEYIIQDIILYFKDIYKSEKVALIGKSSGGYGALVLAMKYSSLINVIASHSPDAYFEYAYIPSFPIAIKNLRNFKDPKEWVEYFWSLTSKKKRDYLETLMIVGLSAFYSPLENGEFELPFELDSGEIIEKVWRKWLEKDPVRLLDKYHENIKNVKVYLDVGRKDEFNLQYGARILHKKFINYGIEHYYEEFDGGHLDTGYRLDVSIPYVIREISK